MLYFSLLENGGHTLTDREGLPYAPWMVDVQVSCSGVVGEERGEGAIFLELKLFGFLDFYN